MLQNSIQSANLFHIWFLWLLNLIQLHFPRIQILERPVKLWRSFSRLKGHKVKHCQQCTAIPDSVKSKTRFSHSCEDQTVKNELKLWHSCGQQRQTSVHKMKRMFLMSGWKKNPLDTLTCNRRVVCFLRSGWERECVRINGSWKLLIKPYKIWINNKLTGVTHIKNIFESYELISFENYYFCQLCYWWKKKRRKERKRASSVAEFN